MNIPESTPVRIGGVILAVAFVADLKEPSVDKHSVEKTTATSTSPSIGTALCLMPVTITLPLGAV